MRFRYADLLSRFMFMYFVFMYCARRRPAIKTAAAPQWQHAAGQTAQRESAEETGRQLTDLYSVDRGKQFYEADNNGITQVPVFVAYVAADADVVLNAEHREFQWATIEEAAQMPLIVQL